MTPRELTAENFRAYPPIGREMAVRRVELLRQLPLAFVALLLRELIAYDWKFPAERADLERQLAYLGPLRPERLQALVADFARLQLTPALERMDWVDQPGLFSEQLSAHLWATRQIENFRGAAVEFLQKVNAAAPTEPEPVARLAMVVIGQGVGDYSLPVFKKLKRQGTHHTNVKATGGFGVLVAAAAQRAAQSPRAFGHWYIDGGACDPSPAGSLTCLSYETLRPLRGALQNRMQKAFESGLGAETLRTQLAQLRPREFGLEENGDRGLLNRFGVSLLTEGSGTQIFSTTFVQWAAREVLRRAQPVTLLARFAPRQRERAMNELLAESQQRPALDPEGSLRDADMGAYYTWLNLQRLPGASSFLAWFENHNQAIAVGPGRRPGSVSTVAVELRELLAVG